MLRTNLLLVLRDFKKHPGFYFTKVLSLAVGITTCLLISGYVYASDTDADTLKYSHYDVQVMSLQWVQAQ